MLNSIQHSKQEEQHENIVEFYGITPAHYWQGYGEKPKGIESTIIDLTENEPKIARIGALYSTILEGMFESWRDGKMEASWEVSKRRASFW